MAKYKANIKFQGIEEKKIFKAGEEFEMTVKRADEIQKNIDKEYDARYGIVLERIDNKVIEDVVEEEIDEEVTEEEDGEAE